ncbi:YheT family hydrolase [Gimesia fumaroli]|uniref:Putative hydrolase n=1 Tax=Gimesia fumaroli TaxID=2527976 RepID=A0A518ICB3_9PLAN|nr:alpha/beta fold hydrolase [Gimesia fumaroli]QDV50748.1 putative hydrolase [Gimesia fumaroli]
MKSDLVFPPFIPHRFYRNAHLQTIVGQFHSRIKAPYQAEQHSCRLPDNDLLIVHDDCPGNWKPGDRVVILLHGLSGCHRSSYMVRLTHKLNQRGVRVFRMDLRGCGAGTGLAKSPYHAGSFLDLQVALDRVEFLCPGSPIGIAGFSLGGTISLNYLGRPNIVSDMVDRAFVLNPPIRLSESVQVFGKPLFGHYQRHFISNLTKHIRTSHHLNEHTHKVSGENYPRNMRDFDDQFTAPLVGYESAEDYYSQCSPAEVVTHINIPTLIITAMDDPLVPANTYSEIRDHLSDHSKVTLHLTKHGGHLGFIGAPSSDPDPRWSDWRIVDWMLSDTPEELASHIREDSREPLAQSA